MKYEMIFAEDYANGIETEFAELFSSAQQNEIIFDLIDGRLRVATLGGELVSANGDNVVNGDNHLNSMSLGKAILASSVTAIVELATLSLNEDEEVLDADYDDGMSDHVYRDGHGMEFKRNFADGKIRNVFGQEYE